MPDLPRDKPFRVSPSLTPPPAIQDSLTSPSRDDTLRKEIGNSPVVFSETATAATDWSTWSAYPDHDRSFGNDLGTLFDHEDVRESELRIVFESIDWTGNPERWADDLVDFDDAALHGMSRDDDVMFDEFESLNMENELDATSDESDDEPTA